MSVIGRIGARFTSHVFPGETLSMKLLLNEESVYFETNVKERGTTALKGFMLLNKPAFLKGGASPIKQSLSPGRVHQFLKLSKF